MRANEFEKLRGDLRSERWFILEVEVHCSFRVFELLLGRSRPPWKLHYDLAATASTALAF